MPGKNYTEMLESVFGLREDYFLEKGKTDVFYLARWILPRLLLGKSVEAAHEPLKSQIASFDHSSEIDNTLKDRVMLAALAEIFDLSAEKLIKKIGSYLSAFNDLDKEDYTVIQTALAVSFYLNDKNEISKWRKYAMQLPFETGAEYVTFELLYLTNFGKDLSINAEHPANITAKIIYKILLGAPFLSSAPHILVLAAIVGNNKNLSQLLKGRIKKLDKIILNNTAKPLVRFGKLKQTFSKTEKHIFVKFEADVRGNGEIKAGCSDDGVLTYDFAPYLNRLAEKDAEFENKLTSEQAKILVEINLSKGVSISEREFQLLKKRFELAFEIAANHIESLTSDYELTLKY